MANSREILAHMNGIKDTMKITNAMYLISSSKLQKVRKHVAQVDQYFDAVRGTIGDILACMPEMDHPFLEARDYHPEAEDRKKDHRHAYLVITADKGLAGAYNLNVLKKAEEEMKDHPNSRLFVVGQVGLHYFQKRDVDMREHFYYSAQDPSLSRARSITRDLLDEFESGTIDEIFVIYTHMKNALVSEVAMIKMFPLSRNWFHKHTTRKISEETFFPGPREVFNLIAPMTMQGIIFSAMTDSYCAELNDRMAAMDGASKNAQEMIENLERTYNRTRQAAITQEITEIIAGSRAQKKKKMHG